MAERSAAVDIGIAPALTPPQTAAPVSDAGYAAMRTLLQVEAEARQADNPRRLAILIANESRKLTRGRQVFVLKRARTGQMIVEAVSSIDVVDRNTPLIRWIERIVRRLAADAGIADIAEFSLPAYCRDDDQELETYPFRNFLWAPLQLRDGTVFAGMLIAREHAWLEADTVVAKRLAGCFAHAWAALSGDRRLNRTGVRKRYLALGAALAVAAAMMLPVPMTALAPAQVVASHPFIVAAPVDASVREILVDPNAHVRAGQPLVSFEDVQFRNELQLAASQVAVAESRLKRAAQAAFDDPEARRELRIAASELELRKAERDYAADVLSKATVAAETSGLAVFSSADDWRGRPVRIGERIMQIADPEKVELRIDLPVADSLVLHQDGRVRLYLDSDPLNPLEARIVEAGHEAMEDESGTLSFRILARLEPESRAPRIGSRGTAQLFGDQAALFYFLFRRPLTAIRQHLGL